MSCVAVVGLSACAGPALSAAVVADAVLESVPADHRDAIDSIECPAFVEPRDQAPGTCTVALGPQLVEVLIDLREPDPEDASAVESDWLVDVTWPKRLVAVGEVADAIAERFTADLGVPTSTTCQHLVLALDPDEAVVCETIDPTGAIRRFDVTVDQAGAVRLSIR